MPAVSSIVPLNWNKEVSIVFKMGLSAFHMGGGGEGQHIVLFFVAGIYRDKAYFIYGSSNINYFLQYRALLVYV